MENPVHLHILDLHIILFVVTLYSHSSGNISITVSSGEIINLRTPSVYSFKENTLLRIKTFLTLPVSVSFLLETFFISFKG